MLVLTRRVGQKIIINKGQIEVKVMRNNRGQMGIGILAPKNMEVDREEIYLKKQRQAKISSGVLR